MIDTHQIDYTVTCNNDQLWKLTELLKFLTTHQEQSIVLGINPEAIDLHALGLYEILDLFNFKSVTIITANPFEYHYKYNIVQPKHYDVYRFLEEKVNIDPILHQWDKSKVFLTMYRRPTASRLGLAGHLFDHHREISHIHFSSDTLLDSLEFYEMNKLLTYNLSSVISVGKMINELPLEVASSQGYSTWGFMANFELALRKHYQHILIDVVGETHVLGNTFFPTEKTTRPMWLKKPFIAFASKDYLCYLRQLGFKTFHDFWDEDYDGYEGRERYLRILQLIDNLSCKSISELNDMYYSMQYTLDHNYKLLQTQSYVNKIEKII